MRSSRRDLLPRAFTRVRTETDLVNRLATYLWEGDGFSTLQTNGPTWDSFTKWDRMSDAKSGAPSRIPIVRPAMHQTLRYVGESWPNWIGDNNRQIRMVPPIGPNLSADALLAAVPFPDATTTHDLAEQAFIDFSARFPAQMSVSEFALGLRDLSAMIPKVQETVSETLASLYLTKSFGWDNLASDLRILGRLCQTVEARLNFLRETYGKPTKLGFYRRNVFGVTPGVVYEVEPARGWGTRVELESYRCDFRAGATLLQYLDHLEGTLGYIRAFAGALGLNNPLKAVWVNLPGSFVIDWFLNVSKHLDRVATLQPAEPWFLLNQSHSFKVHARFKVFQVNDHIMFSSAVRSEKYLGYVTYDGYQREPGLPLASESEIFSLDNINPGQLSLITAIVTGSLSGGQRLSPDAIARLEGKHARSFKYSVRAKFKF